MAQSLKQLAHRTMSTETDYARYLDGIAENEKKRAQDSAVQEYLRRAVDFDKQLLCDRYKLFSS